MTPAARRGASVALAFVLAGVAVGATVRALTWSPPPPPSPIAPALEARARGAMARLAAGLVALQRPDGSFDRAPGDEDPDPEIRQTAACALACAALARARSLGVETPGLGDALAKGLDLLKARQAAAPGGTFGAMPPSPRADPRPSLDATCAGTMALATARRPEDETALRKAASAYVRGVSYGAFQGWTRALAALAADALVREGRADLLTRPVGDLVRESAEDADRIDCTDFRLAEAIARRVRAPGAPFGAEILAACLADPDRPKWTGESSDSQSWYLQAWLAARYPGGAEWFRRVLGAVEEGLEPRGRLPGGMYADPVTQNAAALLALAEGLRPPST